MIKRTRCQPWTGIRVSIPSITSADFGSAFPRIDRTGRGALDAGQPWKGLDWNFHSDGCLRRHMKTKSPSLGLVQSFHFFII
ncbi:hypothetical protein CDAR_393601 [Caerostris darwini]|uniref:Uncharacterized protein n=1 Tax=Caerostris darwini TaxID=1538125 RepID=A0AAV4W7H2_9ARAC|nr:hypothetical protein CDAR_393601 [Caerostris darwini]